MPHRLLLLTFRTVSISQQYSPSRWRVLLRNVWPILSLIILTSSFLLFHPLLLQTSTDSVTLLDTENRCLPLLSSFQCRCHCSITSLHTILSPSDFSFARMPTCAGTHIREILTPLLATSLTAKRILCIRSCRLLEAPLPILLIADRVTAHQDITMFKLSHPLYCHQDSSQLNSKYTKIV